MGKARRIDDSDTFASLALCVWTSGESTAHPPTNALATDWFGEADRGLETSSGILHRRALLTRSIISSV